MIKLIASDLDGTLLNKDHNISDENREAILRAQKAGIEVTIATGRAYYDVANKLSESGLSAHIIGANGATVQLATGERLYSATLDLSDILEGIHWMLDHHHYFALYTEKAIYVHKDSYDWVKEEEDVFNRTNQSYGDKVIVVPRPSEDPFFKTYEKLDDVIHEDTRILKIMAFSLNEEKRQDASAFFEQNNMFNVESSAYANFEVMLKGVTKGAAVTLLAEHLGISMEDTMTIGDNHNDITMLSAAGVGVAMGNADDEVAGHAGYQTLDYRENGVAYAINGLLDGQLDGLRKTVNL